MSLNSRIATGKATGTGVIMTIECGFKPKYIKVFNGSDAGSLWATMEWWEGMTAAYALKGLKQVDSGSTGLSSQAIVTSNGLQQYSGEAPDSTMTGTAAATAGDATISGTNTLFTTELKVGDVININGTEFTVLSITSATALEATAVAAASIATKPYTRKTGRKQGFKVGADGDINAAGEEFYYVAMV